MVFFLSILALSETAAVPAQTPEEVARLIKQLDDADLRVRTGAFQALSERATDFPDAFLDLPSVEEISLEAQEKCQRIQRIALWEKARRQALSALGGSQEGREAVEQLFTHRKTEHLHAILKNDRKTSGSSIDKKALAESLAQFALLEASEGGQSRAKLSALLWLRDLGERSIAPRICQLLEDKDSRVRMHAILVIASLGEKSATPRLIRLLDDPKPTVRALVASVLGDFGEKSAAPQLRRLVQEDPDPGVHNKAVAALKKLGEAPPPTIGGGRRILK